MSRVREISPYRPIPRATRPLSRRFPRALVDSSSQTNDLAGAFAKIGKEQNEYYLIGYTPPDSPEGSCHKLRVKVDRGGTTVRARAGYCNARSNNVLAGSSIEKELESLPVSPAGGRTPP